MVVLPSAKENRSLAFKTGECRVLYKVDECMNVLVAPVSTRHRSRIPFTGTVIKDNGDGLIIDAEESPSETSAIGFLNVYNVLKQMRFDFLLDSYEQYVLIVHNYNIENSNHLIDHLNGVEMNMFDCYQKPIVDYVCVVFDVGMMIDVDHSVQNEIVDLMNKNLMKNSTDCVMDRNDHWILMNNYYCAR